MSHHLTNKQLELVDEILNEHFDDEQVKCLEKHIDEYTLLVNESLNKERISQTFDNNTSHHNNDVKD